LDAHADNLIKAAATGVFLSTAVSQNGRLDGLLVLAAQSQLVWRIAHLYSQRPGPGELTTLYANVAATTFVVGELQDLDLSEQVEPIISSALGSLGGSVPGLRVVSTILVNSVTSGAANAFLTLRVGMIAKRYCGALVAQPRDALRRSATAEAARLLGGIVTAGSRRLTSAVMQAAGSRVADAASVIGSHARSTSGKLWSKLRFGSAKAPEAAPGAG
jgi:hypothetical protein